tara:strand:- start:87 stop:1124 length:1038 start_codon:yes stop_codon:yes gene_type:complete
MERELIIEKFGIGHAVIVLDSKKIINLFIDPPSKSNFYPPNTFVEARIQRRVSQRGAYFVTLPNGSQGFLKSNSDYSQGEAVIMLSKVFFDNEKPQTFTDKLKIISKYFILRLGRSGFSFSRQTSKNFRKENLIPVLEEKIKDHKGIFIICRSRIVDISFEQISEELEKTLQHYRSVMKAVYLKKIYCDGQAKKSALAMYDAESCVVIEEEGIFERLGLWNKINELSQRKIFIPNESYLILEQTSAFFAIDVNSGGNLKVAAKDLNLLACSEVCRLIKVLGIGGKIIIDFLPCAKVDKRIIHDFIVSSFLDDIPTNKIWGWTKGGSFELERERDKSPLKLLIEDN